MHVKDRGQWPKVASAAAGVSRRTSACGGREGDFHALTVPQKISSILVVEGLKALPSSSTTQKYRKKVTKTPRLGLPIIIGSFRLLISNNQPLAT